MKPVVPAIALLQAVQIWVNWLGWKPSGEFGSLLPNSVSSLLSELPRRRAIRKVPELLFSKNLGGGVMSSATGAGRWPAGLERMGELT